MAMPIAKKNLSRERKVICVKEFEESTVNCFPLECIFGVN